MNTELVLAWAIAIAIAIIVLQWAVVVPGTGVVATLIMRVPAIRRLIPPLAQRIIDLGDMVVWARWALQAARWTLARLV